MWWMILLDLAPRSIFIMSLRIVVASVVALAVYHALGETGIIPTAFTVGMFPQRGLNFIETFSQKRLGKKVSSDVENSFSLSFLKDLSSTNQSRLREESIETVCDLAGFSMKKLLLYTPFELGQLRDWKEQAALICVFHEDKEALRSKAGITHASEFVNLGDEDGTLVKIAGLTGLPSNRLQMAHKTLKETIKRDENKNWVFFPSD